MKTMKMLTRLACAAGILLLSACSAPVSVTPKSAPTAASAAVMPESSPTAASAAAPTLLPAATETQTASASASALPANEFSYENVRMALDPALVSGASGVVVPENPGSADGPYWEVNPRYVEISLEGYPLTGKFFEPVISVYPVEEYRKLSPDSGAVIDRLAELLVQKSPGEGQLPFLPVFNAGQVFRSNVEFFDFQNGSGMRFLTIYAQYPAPINNQDLFYTFQGLSADGRYLVSAILPVNHASLPADLNAVPQAEMESIAQDGSYYPNMAATLTAEQASSFTPDLALLDALMASLSIE